MGGKSFSGCTPRSRLIKKEGRAETTLSSLPITSLLLLVPLATLFVRLSSDHS